MKMPIAIPGVKPVRGARSLMGAAILSALVIEPVLAQGLEEVVVTAQRRSQSLQDVGVAVTAISADEARNLGIFNAKDLSKVAPGVLLDSVAGGSVSANLTIRGISQSDYSATQESPNSIYIDEVYIASSSAAAMPLYDLNRVEVLRGPQGTLFGRASSGGLVQFIPKKPTDEFEAYIDAGYGDFNSMYIEGAVSGPLSDSVRGRLSVRGSKADGWYKNELPGGDDTFEDEFIGTRAQLEMDVTDQLTARLSFGYDKSPKHKAGTYTPVSAYVDASGQPAVLPKDVDAYGTGPGNDFTGYRSPYGKDQKGRFNNVGFFESERTTPTLYLTWESEEFTVHSITNYTHFEFEYNEDCDGGPLDFCNFPSNQDLDQWSQELRVSGVSDDLTWTTGLYYLNVDQDVEVAFSFPALSGSDFAFSDVNKVKQELESYGYSVLHVLNGKDAVKNTILPDAHFDLILMDIDLGSGMDGTEAAALILQEIDIPIVFLSSHTEPEITEKTEKITSYGYVVKGSGITILDASIKMAFKLFEEKLKVRKHQLELETINIKLSRTNEQLENTQQEIINREEVLKESEKNLSAVLEYTTDNILSIDRHYNLLTINTAGQEEFKRVLNTELKIGENILDQIPKEYRPKWKERYDRAFAGEQVKEEIMLSDEDTIYYAELTINPIYRKGEIAGAGIFSRDFTERKKMLDKIKENEEQYRNLVETTPDWVWAIDLKGNHIFSNPAVTQLLGYSLKEVVATNAFPLIHPDDSKTVRDMVDNCIKNKKGWSNIPIRWLHKDGSVRWLESTANPLWDNNGKLIGFSGIDRDITERKKAKQ